MKNMTNANENPASTDQNQPAAPAAPAVPAEGSANPGPASNTPAGEPAKDTQKEQGVVDYESGYKELETKIGHQGRELGEYRTFFQNISPLLEKLDSNPELVQAIIDGKIDKQLAQAVYEGRVNVSDAQVVSQASDVVKTEVGQKAYEAMSPEKITELVEEKAGELRKEFEEKADIKTFEEKTQKFIETTSDFVDYADAIDKWLDKHDVTDIEVAYWAVKGQMSEEEAKKAADKAAAEGNQEAVANATGGGVTAQFAEDGTPLIDKLVGGSNNPIF